MGIIRALPVNGAKSFQRRLCHTFPSSPSPLSAGSVPSFTKLGPRTTKPAREASPPASPSLTQSSMSSLLAINHLLAGILSIVTEHY